MTGYDYTAWTVALDQAGYRRFIADAKSRSQQPEVTYNSARARFYLGVCCLVLFGGFFALAFAWRPTLGAYLSTSGAIAFGLALCLGIYITAQALPRFVRRWRLFYRATRFAEANGLEFLVRAPTPDYDGMLFHMPSTENEREYVFTRQGSPLAEAGTMRHTYESYRNPQKDPRTRLWGYFVVELEVDVPSRVVLRTNAKKGVTAMSLEFAKKTGDPTVLDEVYTLYAPPECAAVARQVFSPELMEHIRRLEKRLSPVNAELRGNHLYVFSRKPFDMYNPKIVRLVFDTIAAAQATSPGTA